MVMRVLDRKLWRQLRATKGQVVTIVLIIACGVASLVTVTTAYRALSRSRDAYYSQYRMADLFASVKRVPRSIVEDVRRIEGVRQAEGRIEFEVNLDVASTVRPVIGRAISVPDRRRRILCDLHLTRGQWFEGDGTGEVIVADGFAREHGLEPGDVIEAVMNHKKERLRIVATALSPEFVYLIRGGADILPDPHHFTVMWLTESFAEAVFDFEDAANSIVATLHEDARPDDVRAAIDARLERYGGAGAVDRADQISNRIVTEEIQGLEGTATIVPVIFLGVAAFVLRMLMDRLVRTQRVEIAVFRAYGYTRRELAVHYLKFALVVGLGGAVLGVGLGLWQARALAGVYQEFFRFPVLSFPVDPVPLGVGALVSLGFAVLGALGALRAVLRLQPADGLRPEAPPVHQHALVERLRPLWNRLGWTARMILRNILRTKRRAAVTVGGCVLATAILYLGRFGEGAVQELMATQFGLIERQDVHVMFHAEQGRSALYELRRLPGVRIVEPELGVGVRLRHKGVEERTGIVGLDSSGTLNRLRNGDLEPLPHPVRGIQLSRVLADKLGAREGERIEVEVLYGKKQHFHVLLERIVDDLFGTAAYADQRLLSRWVDEADAVTSARLLIDAEAEAELSRRLKELPAVAGVAFKEQTVATFQKTVAESQSVMNAVILLFSGILTFGVVYNTARITLAERRREAATMRVLGFTPGEVGAVLAGENLVLIAVALVPGLLLGVAFSYGLVQAYPADLYRMPFDFQPLSALWCVVSVILFSLVANLTLLRSVRRLDIVESLKTRE